MDKLLPCPMCGSEADFADVPEGIPTCTNSDCVMSFGLKMSVEQWNTRSPDPRLIEAVKEIEDRIEEMISIKHPELMHMARLSTLETCKGLLIDLFPKLEDK